MKKRFLNATKISRNFLLIEYILHIHRNVAWNSVYIETIRGKTM